jgi:copper ion binding protein
MSENNSMVLNVEGMSCNKCVAKVEKALGDVAGVEKVKVDLAAGKAKVKFSEPVEKVKLVVALETAGFKAG